MVVLAAVGLLVVSWWGQLAAGADVISSSKIESCIADGAQVMVQEGDGGPVLCHS